MIAEIIPEAYDSVGKLLYLPSKKRHRFFAPTLPMRRYVTQPLTVRCHTFTDLREFLRTCRYVPDVEQFGTTDYWLPPEEFERRKQGDCEDFALWTWRQMLTMGYEARFVGGSAGRYGVGHAWVTFRDGGRTFLLEPLLAAAGETMPRLKTLRYQPAVSVEWDGQKLRYFEHEGRAYDPPLLTVLALLPEWVAFWCYTRPLCLRGYLRWVKRGLGCS